MDKFTRVRQSSTKKLSFNLTLSIANFVMMREYYNTTYISVLFFFRIGLLLLPTTITTTPIKTPVEWSSRKISEGFWLQGLPPWPNVYRRAFSSNIKKTRELWSFLFFYCSSNKLCDKNVPFNTKNTLKQILKSRFFVHNILEYCILQSIKKLNFPDKSQNS